MARINRGSVWGAGLVLLGLSVAASACGGGGGGGNPPPPPPPPPQNHAPNAALDASTLDGNAPLPVAFDASGSFDADNDIAAYIWDFDGDGTADRSTSEPAAAFVYTAAGAFEPTVTVRDAAQLSDTAQVSLNVGALSYTRVDIDPVDYAPASAETLSGVIAGGRPACAYCSPDMQGLLYYRALNAEGSSWAAPLTLDPAAVAYAALAIVEGNPAVLYYRPADHRLLYLRAQDATGASWPAASAALTVFDNVGLVPTGAKLLASGGRLTVVAGVFDGAQSVDLYVANSSDARGILWSFSGIPIAQLNDSAGAYATAVIGGRPAVAIGERGAMDVQFLRAEDAAGLLWPADTQAVADGVASFSQYFYLAETGGRPTIAGTITPEGGLEPVTVLLQSADAAGAAWSQNEELLHFREEVLMDFKVLAGFPVMAIDSNNSESIRCLVGSDARGSDFKSFFNIIAEDGYPVSLVEVNQRPAAFFMDEDTGALSFVVGN